MPLDSRLNGWRSILNVIAFFVTNLIVVFPFVLPIPSFLAIPLRKLLVACRVLPPLGDQPVKWRIKFNYANVPVIVVLFLLACTSIDGQTVRNGIVGVDGIQPLDIMALFISLAYLSISLDATGLLRFLAFWVTKRGGSSSKKLYFYLYLLFFCLGIIIGNDPVILSGTAFLAYLTHMSRITPTPWVYAQFSAANVASAVLVSSNPTNLVLSGAFGLPYTNYTAFLILPTLIAGIGLYPTLVCLFKLVGASGTLQRITGVHPRASSSTDPSSEKRKSNPLIPPSIHLPPSLEAESARSMLLDPWGAIIGTFLLLTTLIVLVATSPIKPTIPVWRVTVPGALLMIVRDVVADRERWKGGESGRKIRKEPRRKVTVDFEAIEREERRKEEQQSNYLRGHDSAAEKSALGLPPREDTKSSDATINGNGAEGPLSRSVDSEKTIISDEPAPMAADTCEIPNAKSPTALPSLSRPAPSSSKTLSTRLTSLTKKIESYLPTSTLVLKSLPLPLLPFAFSMFVLVQGLASSGWVDVFASWWGIVESRAGVAGSVFVMTLLSSVLCNVCGTNIGTTILFARTLKLSLANDPSLGTPFKSAQTNPVIFALAFGTNIGAFTFSFSASLAGLLWRGILRQKGVYVPLGEFASLNLVLWAVAAVVGSSVLVVQHVVIN